MSQRWSETDLAKFTQNSGRVVKAQAEVNRLTKPKKPSKYRNKPCLVDGMRFDSQLEAARYKELKLLQAAGYVEYFLRQVPFHLPGGIIYRVDFQIFWRTQKLTGGRETYEDCKGFDTRAGINKIRQVRALYGVEVALVRK